MSKNIGFYSQRPANLWIEIDKLVPGQSVNRRLQEQNAEQMDRISFLFHRAAQPQPPTTAPPQVPPFFFGFPTWEDALSQTEGTDFIRYKDIGNATYFVMVRNPEHPNYGTTYAIVSNKYTLERIINNLPPDYSLGQLKGRIETKNHYEELNLLPDLASWYEADLLHQELLWNDGKYLSQWNNYYSNWIRTHWNEEEIHDRIWSVIYRADGSWSGSPYDQGRWLLGLLLPHISSVRESDKTERNFKKLLARFEQGLKAKNDPNCLTYLGLWLKDSRFAQGDAAVYKLKSTHNLELKGFLIQQGVKDRDLPVTYRPRCSVSGQTETPALLTLFKVIEEIDEEQEELFLECMWGLASQTSNVDIIYKRKTTYLEKIYLSSKDLSKSLRLKTVAILIYNGATLSPEQLDQFRHDFEKGETALLPLLFAKGHITIQEYNSYRTPASETLSFSKASPQDLENALVRSYSAINRMLERGNIAPDALDFEKVAYWRLLKKEAKQRNVGGSYYRFCYAYDQLVQGHPILRLLRKVSVEIRSIKRNHLPAASDPVAIFLAIWADRNTTQYNPEHINELIRQDPNLFEAMRKRTTHVAARYFRDPFWYSCRQLWVHGTRSSVLVTMGKMTQKALMTVNTLFKMGIVPPCGEFCGSHEGNGVNAQGLSGEVPATSWADARNPLFNTAGNLAVSINYASQENQYSHDLVFDPKASWKLASIENAEHLLTSNRLGFRIDPQEILKIRIAIMRLRMTDPTANNKLAPLKQWLDEKHSQKYYDNFIGVLKEALECPIGIALNADDIKKITDPYPILFGCPDQIPISTIKIGGRATESIHKEGLQLGKEIQMVFTPATHLQKLRQELAGTKVRAEEFDMALMIETMEMEKGSGVELELIKFTTLPNAQIKLNIHLQRTILPYYAAMLPEAPQGRPVAFPFAPGCPTYADYRLHVEQGALPREIHGCMHSARTTFWSQILAVLYDNVENPILLGIAAGLHDSARQDEWQDQDEAASGANVGVVLRRFQVSEATIAQHVYAVVEKDPRHKPYTDSTQEIIHNADCFEIIRIPTVVFDKRFLSFTQLKTPIDPELLKVLIPEITAFIKQTEDPDLKKKLEQKSRHYYFELLSLFKKTHLEKGCYPNLFKIAQSFLI